MKYEVDSYLFYQHPFRVRQHLVNHVDMIFGLGREEQSNTRDGRLLLVGDVGRWHISHLWEFDDARAARARSWVLGESLFATGYEQVYLLHDGEYFAPGDLGDDDEREKQLSMSDATFYSMRCSRSASRHLRIRSAHRLTGRMGAPCIF